MELANRTALITGGTSGIGAATAKRLAREGAEVIVAGRNASDGAKVIREITEAKGRARFVAVDLADLHSVRRLVEAAATVDILINNAAEFPVGPTVEQAADDFERALATNVRAPYFLTAALVPRMLAKGRGAVVNVSSMAAEIGIPGLSVYSASKAALNSLTRTWAAEFAGGGVRVNTVAPGPTRTDKVMATMGDSVEQLAKSLPMARVAAPQEIAEVILFLSSDRASFITGAIVAVDGGRTAV